MVWANRNIILYHGTNSVAERQIAQTQQFDLAICRPSVDFGKGIYTTTNLSQAEQWARRSAKRFNRMNQSALVKATPRVIKFNVDRDSLAGREILFFVRANPDYWEMVKHCRNLGNHARVNAQPWYEVVVGPVANADLASVIPDYDQVSFHTPDACAFLYNAIVVR